MWYTHYNDKEITEETNELYRELLAVIPTDEGPSLLTLFKAHEADEEKHEVQFEKYFHEYWWTEEGLPRLSSSFTKTARKRYDIAVILSYAYNSLVNWWEMDWDYRSNNNEDIVQWIQEQNVELLTMWLIYYIKEEEIDILLPRVDIIVWTFFENTSYDPEEVYDKEQEMIYISGQIAAGISEGNTGKTARSLDMERV